MNKLLTGMLVSTLTLSGAAFAGLVDVTTWDNEGVAYEDGETEPGTVNSQIWDLEGVFLGDNQLSMVGGFNFMEGVASRPTYTSGDLFISVGTPKYGTDAPSPDGTNLYGYDFVFDIDWDGRSNNQVDYKLLSIDRDTNVINSYANQHNPGSNPWKYGSEGDDVIDADTELAVTGTLTMTNTNVGDFAGDTHYMLSGFDLTAIYASIADDAEFFSHFTMGCGNDNLMGNWQATAVPESSTIALFAIGFSGLFFARRRQQKLA